MQASYEAAMRHALAISLNGPYQGVNPQVGCVILNQQGEFVAEGYHQGSGTDHAEVVALKQLKAKLGVEKLPPGYTAVVTLEPCNHTGKTPPCAQGLIEAGITRVVFAAADPGDISGSGAQTLRAAGVEVIGNFLEAEAAFQNRVWLTANRMQRPFVSLKWGSSLDGRSAAQDGSSKWITNQLSREDVHLQRSRADAILIGTRTAIEDNPELTARKPDGSLYQSQPIRIVVGKTELSKSLKVFSDSAPTILFPTRDINEVLAELWNQKIKHVFVEGGPTIASRFLELGLVDELLIYLAPKLIGGPKTALQDFGVTNIAEALELEILEQKNFDSDVFFRARIRRK